jgi:hypothetical protein
MGARALKTCLQSLDGRASPVYSSRLPQNRHKNLIEATETMVRELFENRS